MRIAIQHGHTVGIGHVDTRFTSSFINKWRNAQCAGPALGGQGGGGPVATGAARGTAATGSVAAATAPVGHGARAFRTAALADLAAG